MKPPPQPLAGWRLRQVVADTYQLSKVGGFLYLFGWAVIGWIDGWILPLIPSSYQPNAVIRDVLGPDYEFPVRGVGVLLISSELDELLRVADRVLVMFRGRLMGSCRADPAERERIGAWMAGQDA